MGMPSSDSSETKLCRSSRGGAFGGYQTGCGYDASKVAPDVGVILWSSVSRREHQAVVLPSSGANGAPYSDVGWDGRRCGGIAL